VGGSVDRSTEEILVDTVRLGRWLDGLGIEVGPQLTVEPLPGGASNAMFCVDRGAARWVLRRPPNVAVERANAGMVREYRILAALDESDVPHPRVVALCEDHEILGCTFFVMQRVEGVIPLPVPPSLDDEKNRHQIAFAMVETLARLHDFDWNAAGLNDLGRPEAFHERQVARWRRQLVSYEGRELPGIDTVMSWLEANRPASFEPTLMHGDFHMRNVLIAPDPVRVVAVLDWETATIGDPLLDLAGFCEIWCPMAAEGWPSRQELVEHYFRTRGREVVGRLTYYEVLYNFRLAVLMEGIYQRSLRDPKAQDKSDLGVFVLNKVNRAVELVTT
jgi:aminoglycoside phosphotransferase (APT) family kinase protein